MNKDDINEIDDPTFSNQQSDQIDEPISEQAVDRAMDDRIHITLDPDVAAVFRDAASVNRVLRALIDTMPLTSISATVPVRIYPTHGFDQLDQRISATVDGQLLPFVRHVTTHPSKRTEFWSSRTRFATAGSIEIRVREFWLENPVLRGIGTNEVIRFEDGHYVLELPGPGHYYLSGSNTAEKIYIWYDDIHQVQSPSEGVIDVTTLGVRPDRQADQTIQIQQLIDACPSGGTLYFPPGEYRAGHLNVHRDAITIYMEGGAILKGVDDAQAFMTREYGKNLIHVQGNHVVFDGPGTIDANGMVTYSNQNGEIKIHLMDVDMSDGLILRNTLFMDSNSWNIHLRKSRNIQVENIKIFSGKDGLDVDSTSNVVVDTVFIESIDDNIPMKSRYVGVPTRNVLVRNCMVKTRKSALKIGTENRAPIEHITFDTCEVIDGQRALNIAPSDDRKGPISDIVFRNIRIFMSPALDGRSGYAILGSNGGADVRNIRYENIVMTQVLANVLDFDAELRRIRLYMQAPWRDGEALFFLSNSQAYVKLEDVIVYWSKQKERWGPLTVGGKFQSENLLEVESDQGIASMVLEGVLA